MPELAELVARFLVIGALAFGGGAAALPLVERLAVAETGWLTPQEFATGVGFAYATPGPVLILAPFIGYRVGGLPGAVLATLAVFLIPVLLAGAAAGLVARLRSATWFQGFGAYAAAAAVGLLGLTLYALAKPVFLLHPALLLGSGLVFYAAWRGLSPLALIAAAIALGAIGGALWGSSELIPNPG
ncbi:MAG: chromate transporter [Burkholderiales bacterium]